MPGDYSRITFTQAKHYSGVLMQQGRVQLDADWNEQLDIQQHRTHTETIDTVGMAGVPKNTMGFQITAVSGNQLIINAGRFYLNGLLCELEQAVPYLHQPYYPNPDTSFFGNPPGQLSDGLYITYLDAWQREINFRDDPHIHEVALGEADTTTRRQTVWQVRLLPVAQPAAAQPTCQTVFPEWTSLIAPPTGRLMAQVASNVLPRDPCSLPPTTGYRRLENQLYRIEVQRSGNRGVATFKWSRDNATVETTIEAINNATLTVSDLGRDEVLGFAPGHWVEIIHDTSSLNRTPNPLLQIQAIDSNTRQITLNGSATTYAGQSGLKLRRWDQNAASVAMAAGWIDLEDGVQVQFQPGTYQAGDFWTFAARTNTGDIEWLRLGGLPQPQPPAGTSHAYAQLALVRAVAGVMTVIADCRPQFPPLTAISADDVSFDNTNCQFGQANTVQEAIDLLCSRRNQGSCTLTATPGPGWEVIFDQIAPDQDAQICFPVGEFPLRTSVTIANKGHLKLNGSGPGTRIRVLESEAALVFEGCKSVLIRDLYAEANQTKDRSPKNLKALSGTLTFLNCPSVDVEQVDLLTGPGPVRAATCLTVSNNVDRPGAVRVSQCDFEVGNLQQGILLINVTTATVANNTLRTAGRMKREIVLEWLNQETYRAQFRQLFFRRPATIPSDRGNYVTVPFLQENVSFRTHPSLRRAWLELLHQAPFARRIKTKQLALEELKRIANRLLRDEAFRKRAPAPFQQLFDQLADTTEQAASQGITVGGRIARDVRILNNTIVGSVQGIRVGQSHEQAAQGDTDRADTVLISGNTLDLVLPATVTQQDRHGIFVGNVDSLIIENNTLRLTRHPEVQRLANDGIRVWGFLGPRVLINQNMIPLYNGDNTFGYSCGIRLHPLLKDRALWLVMRNVASHIETSNGAFAENNFP